MHGAARASTVAGPRIGDGRVGEELCAAENQGVRRRLRPCAGIGRRYGARSDTGYGGSCRLCVRGHTQSYKRRNSGAANEHTERMPHGFTAGIKSVRGVAAEASTIHAVEGPDAVSPKTALPENALSWVGWQVQAMRNGAVLPDRSRRTTLGSPPLATTA